MDYQRIPKPGEIYKHFKNKLYQIITIAIHTENEEQLVIYQALYGDYKIFARPLNMFLSEVDHNKYPEVSQKYRFELCGHNYTVDEMAERGIEEETVKKVVKKSELKKREADYESTNNPLQAYENTNNQIYENTNNQLPAEELTNESGVNPVLLDFLDANSYNEKLAVITNKKKYIDDRLLNDMAISIDCTIEEGTIEERIRGLIFALETLARFESKRLR